MTMNKMKKFILDYTTKGYYLLPVMPNDKKPAIDDWRNQASNNYQELIEAIEKTNAPLNLGITTGEKSNLLIIDVDNHNGVNGLASLKKLSSLIGDLPITYTVKTPSGGIHYYFKYPSTMGIEYKNKVGIADGIDVRAEGGYVVAPPSKINDVDYTVTLDVPTAELPNNWIEYIYNEKSVTILGGIKINRNEDGSADILLGNQKFDLPDVLHKGSRNDILLRYGASLMGKGESLDTIKKLVKQANIERQEDGTKPLTDQELENTIFKSLTKYKSSRDKQLKEKVLNTMQGIKPMNDTQKIMTEAMDEAGITWLSVSPKGEYKILEPEYAKHFVTDVYKDKLYFDGIGFLNSNGERISEQDIKLYIQTEIEPYVKTNIARKVVALIECIQNLTGYNVEPYPNEMTNIYSNISDQFLTFVDGEFVVSVEEKDRPQIGSVNIDINENLIDNAYSIDNTLFKKWLDDLFGQDEQDILQEYIGYCMIPSTRGQCMLEIIGGAGIGKSRILTILQILLGNSKISNCKLHNLEKENYLYDYIANKLVLYDDDIKTSALEESGMLKDLITSEGKKFKVTEKYKPTQNLNCYAKLLACGNTGINAIYDKGNGLWRRIIPIYTKEFNYKDSKRQNIPENVFRQSWEKDKNIIFRWALDGLTRLINNNWQFSHIDKIQDQRDKAQIECDNVQDFITNCDDIVFDEEGFITCQDLYDIYKNFCYNMATDEPATSYNRFCKRFKALNIKNISTCRNSSCRGYKGVRIARETKGKIINFNK